MRTDAAGAAFDSCPSVICTGTSLASLTSSGGVGGEAAASYHAVCDQADTTGFTLSLVPTDDATPMPTSVKGGAAAAAPPAAASPTAQPPAAAAADPAASEGANGGSAAAAAASRGEASEEEHAAAAKLQARARGQLTRTRLAAAADSSAACAVGWLACDGTHTGDGVLSGLQPQPLGAWSDIHFDVDYPEPPVLLYGLVGGGTRRMRVGSVDERGARLLCEAPEGEAAESASPDAKSVSAAEPMLGWVALPNGRLWPLGDGDDEDDDDAGEGGATGEALLDEAEAANAPSGL